MAIMISKCLAGYCCKYNGGHNHCDRVERLMARRQTILVCPEQLGQLPTPREPSEIQGGDGADVLAGRARVVSPSGEDRTDAFLTGAQRTLELCLALGVKAAVCKANSPSCGCGYIYDGTFSKTLCPGDGVTAALLRQEGIPVFTEAELTEEGELPPEWEQML